MDRVGFEPTTSAHNLLRTGPCASLYLPYLKGEPYFYHLENTVLAFLLVVIMLFTIPNAIIQNPKKRKMIGPGNVIKVKPLVDTTPAIAISVPVTINKIDTKIDPLFIETKNAVVANAIAPKPKIIPLIIELSGNKSPPPAAFVATSTPETRNSTSAAMANAFANLTVKVPLSPYLDIATLISGCLGYVM